MTRGFKSTMPDPGAQFVQVFPPSILCHTGQNYGAEATATKKWPQSSYSDRVTGTQATRVNIWGLETKSTVIRIPLYVWRLYVR